MLEANLSFPDLPTLDRRRLLLGLSAAASGAVAARTTPVLAAGDGSTLPMDFDASRGTVVVGVCLADGRHVARAYSWSPTGYALVEDGVVIDRVGTV